MKHNEILVRFRSEKFDCRFCGSLTGVHLFEILACDEEKYIFALIIVRLISNIFRLELLYFVQILLCSCPFAFVCANYRIFSDTNGTVFRRKFIMNLITYFCIVITNSLRCNWENHFRILKNWIGRHYLLLYNAA